MKKYSYNTVSKNPFHKTVDDLLQSIERNRFAVLHIHNIQETFAGKGIEHDEYKIIEFCRAPMAKKVLDINPLIGLFLPCKAIVYKEGAVVKIALMSPQIISSFFTDSSLKEIAKEIDGDIQNILVEYNSL